MDLKYNCIKGTWIEPNYAIVNNKKVTLISKGYCPWDIKLGIDYYFEIERVFEYGFIINDYVPC